MNSVEFLKKQTQIIINLYNTNQFSLVINKAKILIKKFPEQMLPYNILALSLANTGKSEEGIDVLNKALKHHNNNIFIFNNLGLLNSNLDNNKLAKEYFIKALSINSEFVDALVNLANVFLKENKTELAEKNYLKALKFAKNNQHLEIINNALGLYYQQIGEFKKSIEHLKIVAKINPSNTQIDKLISTIHKYSDENDEHIKDMEKKIQIIKDKTKLKSLYFALGKAYEDIKNYKDSFNFLKLGNDIANTDMKYNVEQDIFLLNKIIELFKGFKNSFSLDSKRNFIFIVGMPRSGTTITEQIISSHQDVYGAGELPFLEKLIKKYILKDDIFISENISNINVNYLESIQNEYVKKVEELEYNEKFLIDKAPLNFRWIGFIKILFPNSKIIHCKRDPMDTCFSNYKNSFSQNSLGFSYNLDDLGKYYNSYKNLMAFWNNIFSDQIYNLNYENLVINQKYETENLLKFCNLRWDDKCLIPHKNKKRVATASLEQIRKPIYQTSLKKWENYSEYLSSLKKVIS